jgi:hypothetical protein
MMWEIYMAPVSALSRLRKAAIEILFPFGGHYWPIVPAPDDG